MGRINRRYYRKCFQMGDLCDLEADYKAGLISYQEYKEGRFEAYLIAKAEADKKFESIYGFIPQSIKRSILINPLQ